MKIAFLFYEGMTALDAIGPHEILSRLPGASTFRVAERAGPIQTDSSQLKLIADYSLADVTSADVVLVPGAGNATALSDHPETLEWLKSIHVTTTWTTSVCTGSLILGAAGILSNLKATTHWAAFDRLKLWKAVPTKARVVEDGKVITAAGVSAGIDMALILSSKIAGEKFAQTIQLGIEYDPDPPFDVGSPEKADPMIREKLRSRMTANFVEVSHELSN
jgi:transcriptional regulator GlxA family with amidase domain